MQLITPGDLTGLNDQDKMRVSGCNDTMLCEQYQQ